MSTEFESLYKLMAKRQSVRSFRDKALTDSQIRKIIDAAVTAPSSLNSQPWLFVAMKDAGAKKRLREIYTSTRKKLGLYEQDTSFVENSTPIVVVCEDSSYDKVLSCGMAIQNMFLAAEAMGLGCLPAVTILLDKGAEQELAELINVSAPRKIVLLTFFGHKEGATERKPKKETGKLIFNDRIG